MATNISNDDDDGEEEEEEIEAEVEDADARPHLNTNKTITWYLHTRGGDWTPYRLGGANHLFSWTLGTIVSAIPTTQHSIIPVDILHVKHCQTIAFYHWISGLSIFSANDLDPSHPHIAPLWRGPEVPGAQVHGELVDRQKAVTDGLSTAALASQLWGPDMFLSDLNAHLKTSKRNKMK